ncbi:hypothetical protein G4B88_019123 [Cannabis sativa]|uniref:Reverse transcriptase zinc-binding domain-containing protein n=1 Tax=Cannabis sativa TaxID=3483 RepID=A0A7J6HM86_CANSA|nr:hypothetical protein G4B88_019123 [Cannabis sativa]
MAEVLSQQSKVNWIKFSDENLSYFHVVMRKRRLENEITTFTTGDTIVDDFEEVVNHFVKHFETSMGSKSTGSSTIDEACIKFEEVKVDYASASWDKLIVPKHKFIFWQILNSQLLTRDYLNRIIAIQSVLCPVCEAEVETHDH